VYRKLDASVETIDESYLRHLKNLILLGQVKGSGLCLQTLQKNPGVRIQHPEEGFAIGSFLRISSQERSDIPTLLASGS
jgi:hypothetical protein